MTGKADECKTLSVLDSFARLDYRASMVQPSLFPFDDPPRELSDTELTDMVHGFIVRGMHLSREADLFLASLCAGHLVQQLRAEGVMAVKPARHR
jgi:hypothetical protein